MIICLRDRTCLFILYKSKRNTQAVDIRQNVFRDLVDFQLITIF
jgi:hypothetical protein